MSHKPHVRFMICLYHYDFQVTSWLHQQMIQLSSCGICENWETLKQPHWMTDMRYVTYCCNKLHIDVNVHFSYIIIWLMLYSPSVNCICCDFSDQGLVLWSQWYIPGCGRYRCESLPVQTVARIESVQWPHCTCNWNTIWT